MQQHDESVPFPFDDILHSFCGDAHFYECFNKLFRPLIQYQLIESFLIPLDRMYLLDIKLHYQKNSLVDESRAGRLTYPISFPVDRNHR